MTATGNDHDQLAGCRLSAQSRRSSYQTPKLVVEMTLVGLYTFKMTLNAFQNCPGQQASGAVLEETETLIYNWPEAYKSEFTVTGRCLIRCDGSSV